MDNNELRNKHFAALKEKYQVSSLKGAASSEFLYFILRKAELAIKITGLEKQWLFKNSLFETIEIISLQQYQATEQDRIKAECLNLRPKYKVPEGLEFSISSPMYSILWRVESGEFPGEPEISFLKDQKLLETVTLIQDISIFKKLKSSYKATQYVSDFPEEPLCSILKKLNLGEELSQIEENWLLDNDLQETLQIYWDQEEERKAAAEFYELKEKYSLALFPEQEASSFLYPILKKIDQEHILAKSECNWLQGQRLNSLLEIDQRHRDLKEFKELKEKYQVHQCQDSELYGRLFTILQNLNSGSIINESDIQWLEEQKLIETAKIARVIHFAILKKKYQIVGQLPVEPFYGIMLKLERGERLDPKQVVQLIEERQLSRHGKIAMAHYRLEAMFHEQEYKRTGNLWNLPSASSNWRKANESKNALKSTDKVNWKKVREPDLQSALWVTRGAAFRDLNQLQDAENCAAEAMDCQPGSHQPYTLMGAIYYDRGEYVEGDQWFAMAVERGANDTDDEIERIVRMTKDKEKRREVIEYLLEKDPIRYAWTKSYRMK